jgi:hypothetical protein
MEIIYTLCTATASACAFLMLRSYFKNGYRLLWWSGLCFVGLAIANVLVIFDRLVIESYDLSTLRYLVALVSLLPLLYGLIWEER